MNRILVFPTLILLFIVVSALKPIGQANRVRTVSCASKKGWTPLFDGKTTTGWHEYGKDTSANWKVVNGALYLGKGIKGGDLVSNEEFSDFHLKLEWKLAPGGNSGIIFYINEDPKKYYATYVTGPEMQVLDNERHSDAKIHKHRAGDLYDLIASKKETVKPAGEWNKVEIKSYKGQLQFFLNGTKTVETTMWNEQWRSMIAASKFAKMTDFGTFKKGKIALQNHGDEVWYRNILIKRL